MAAFQYDIFGRGRPLRLAIMFACQLSFVLFGYDQGVFSGVITNKQFLATMKNPNDSLTGLIVSIYNLGCFTGCIINFFIGDYLGRRKAMWFAMVWIIIGATLQTSSFSVAQLMAARFVTGIGTGIETSTTPMFQAELSTPEKRGRLVCSMPLYVGVGIVISYFFDYGMSYVSSPPGIAWRLPIACQIIFAIIVVFLVFGLPESPRYAYQKGRKEEAINILCDVYDKEPDDPQILQEQADILEALEIERINGEYKWRNILKRDDVQTGRRVLLAYGMQFMNQMGGINLVVYYVPTALESNVGLSHQLALIIGGCVQTMFVVGSFYPTFFVDKVGRRAPMMWGSLGCGISMMLIATCLSVQGAHQKAASSAAVAWFFTYMLTFGASVNCIPWVYVPEILPLHARAKGTAVGISSNWLWNFFVVMITPVILNRLKWKGYLIFMVLNFAFIPLVYFCYPETAGLSLEEMDLIFTGEIAPSDKGWRKLGKQGVVELSLEMRKERMSGREESFVQDVGGVGDGTGEGVVGGGRRRSLAERRASQGARSMGRGEEMREKTVVEQREKA